MSAKKKKSVLEDNKKKGKQQDILIQTLGQEDGGAGGQVRLYSATAPPAITARSRTPTAPIELAPNLIEETAPLKPEAVEVEELEELPPVLVAGIDVAVPVVPNADVVCGVKVAALLAVPLTDPEPVLLPVDEADVTAPMEKDEVEAKTSEMLPRFTASRV